MTDAGDTLLLSGCMPGLQPSLQHSEHPGKKKAGPWCVGSAVAGIGAALLLPCAPRLAVVSYSALCQVQRCERS